MISGLRRTLLVAAVPAVLLQPAPPLGARPVPAPPPVDLTGHDEDLRVVAFDDSITTADEMAEVVEQAGGQVVDALDVLGVALVAPGDTWADDAAGDGAIVAGARNRRVGRSPAVDVDRLAQILPSAEERAAVADTEAPDPAPEAARSATVDPLTDRQWGNEMIGATEAGAHRAATGDGVAVGIIDTGIDAGHPDLAPNLDLERSRDLVTGGPPDRDPHGHGTHVAGVVGAAQNDLGITGVAPDVDLVNLRAGQESGHFFVYEVSSALVAAGDLGLDVVVMSFFTDPWLYNCASADDYVSGTVTDEEIAEQAMVRRVMLDALDYARDRGVTLVAAAGNDALDMAAPERVDGGSPGYPPGQGRLRTVTNNCLDLPAEGPGVLTVSAVGPSGVKADYANHGLGSIDLTAPGGWFRDHAGTELHQRPENLVLSTFPLEPARRQGLADDAGHPTDPFSHRDCLDDECGFYTYAQGTSMSAPYVAGVAALVIDAGGAGAPGRGTASAPDRVTDTLLATAVPQPCPASGVVEYRSAGRPASWDAPCVGTDRENSVYGHGIVDAAAAVERSLP